MGRETLFRLILWAGCTAILTIALLPIISTLPPFQSDGQHIRVLDFPYHLRLVSGAVLDSVGDIYSLPVQLNLLTSSTGQSVTQAMPVGMSPSIIILLLPFVAAEQMSLSAAHALWDAVSIATCAIGFLALVFRTKRSPERRLLCLFALLTLCSSLTNATLVLGQTSLLALGVLLLYCDELFSEKSGKLWKLGLLAAILSIKLPYLAIAAVLAAAKLPIRGTVQVLMPSLLLGALSFVILPFSSLSSFIKTLAMYSAAQIPPSYSSSISYTSIGTVAGVWKSVVPDATPGPVLVLALLTICVLGIAWAKRSEFGSAALLPIIIGAFLLLTPYSGIYEDLLMVLPVVRSISLGYPTSKARAVFRTAVILALLNRPVHLPASGLTLIVFLKVALILELIDAARLNTASGARNEIADSVLKV